jgi:ATP-dependent Clp protease protease subunit
MKRPVQIYNFHVLNQGNGTVDVHIDGDIVDASTQEMLRNWWGDETSVSYKSFRNEVTTADPKTLNVIINSNGGHVGDAMAIHDFLTDLENKGVKVNRIGRGIIASAGTYILMGNNSEMSENSFLMIHNISMVVYGDINQVENQAKAGRKFNDQIRDFYANQTGIRKEDITKMMDNETWFTANEAKDKGFVKNVSNKVTFTNSIKPENWQFQNTAILNTYNASVKEEPSNSQNEDMKKLFADFKETILNAIKGVKVDDKTTHESLRNSIAEAVSNSFEKLGEQMEAAVNDSIGTALKGKDVKDALILEVKNAVDAATKDLSDKITNLEKENGELKKKNEDLEKDLTNKLGKPSNSAGQEGVQAIGSFS